MRFLAGYGRPGLVDEAPLEYAFARVVDGNLSVFPERRVTGNRPVWRVRPALLAPVVTPPAGHGSFPTAVGGLGAAGGS